MEDPGFKEVRELSGLAAVIASAWHAKTEVVSALHRAFREGRIDQAAYSAALAQFLADSEAGLFKWLPLTEAVQQRIERFYLRASSTTFLRAADALHLSCAVENSFPEVYSNDRHLLAAATQFGLKGAIVIGAKS